MIDHFVHSAPDTDEAVDDLERRHGTDMLR
jgi:hypothetical protein